MSPDPVCVCQVISSFYPKLGGAERVTEDLCAELEQRGVEVVVFTRTYPETSRVGRVRGVPVRRLGTHPTGKIGALTFAFHALLLLATRFRNYRLVHVQSSGTPIWIGLLCKLLLRRRVVVTVHTDARGVFAERKFSGRIRLLLTRRLSDAVCAVSPIIRRQLIEKGVPDSLLEHFPNGVDTAVFYPPSAGKRNRMRARLGIPADALFYLFIGRVASEKRVDLLLRAWVDLSLAPERMLYIVGDGPARREWENLSQRLRLEAVRFRGPTESVLPYLHAADVLVLPSTREGQSIALLEAMACGLTCLASDIPANRALISHGYTGLLFTSEDVGSLRRALEATTSRELRERLGRHAARAVVTSYDIRVSAERHASLYRRLLGAPPEAFPAGQETPGSRPTRPSDPRALMGRQA